MRAEKAIRAGLTSDVQLRTATRRTLYHLQPRRPKIPPKWLEYKRRLRFLGFVYPDRPVLLHMYKISMPACGSKLSLESADTPGSPQLEHDSFRLSQLNGAVRV